MSSPTLRQIQTLQAIAQYRAERGYSPSYKDLMAALDVRSTNAVACLLSALDRRGLISRDVKVARSLTLTDAGARWVLPSPCLLSGAEVAEVA